MRWEPALLLLLRSFKNAVEDACPLSFNIVSQLLQKYELDRQA